jgi:leader peptidase (prepilin peptidase) / N-methyltransferase
MFLKSAVVPLIDLAMFLPDLFAFVFGAVIGSFLNVVIHRVPLEKSIVLPNSACPSCQANIKPWDNIPVLSWLLLKGKCRSCQTPISIRYPAIELLTATVFLAVYRLDNFSPILPFDLLFASALICLIFIDAEHMILPDAINYPGLLIALGARVLLPLVFAAPVFDDLKQAPLNEFPAPAWLTSLTGAALGALCGGGSLWLLGWLWKRFRGIDAMGMGDVKMMFFVGAYLGWRLTLVTLFLAALTGALCGVGIVFFDRERGLQSQIPFGIFLGVGALVALFAGDFLISWYLNAFVGQ